MAESSHTTTRDIDGERRKENALFIGRRNAACFYDESRENNAFDRAFGYVDENTERDTFETTLNGFQGANALK